MSGKTHARRTTRAAMALYLAIALGASAAVVAASTPAGATPVSVTVNPLNQYTSTGITVTPGELVKISASGTVNVQSGNAGFDVSPSGNLHEMTGPSGIGCFPDYGSAGQFPMANTPCWSLIARIGGGAPFYIGNSLTFPAQAGGALDIGINDDFLGDNQGSWSASITDVTFSGVTSPQTFQASSLYGANVSYAVPSATDESGSIPVSCLPKPGSLFGPGSTNVLCKATDRDNTLTATVPLTVVVNPTVADPPSGVTATPGNASATVSFPPTNDPGASPLTGYTAKCSSNNGSSRSATASGSPITVTGLTNGNHYFCTVTANNGSGPGVPSAPSNEVVPGIVVSCNTGQPCDVMTTTPVGGPGGNPAASVDVQAVSSGPNGSIAVSPTAPLQCPGSPLTISNSTSIDSINMANNLTVTVKIQGDVSGLVQVCYSSPVPFLSQHHQSSPMAGTDALLSCATSPPVPAPCVISVNSTSSPIVVKILIPSGDPAFSIVVPRGRLLWPSNFPKGKVGAAYSQHMQSKGGKAPFKWKVASGKLAPGLTLGASTGAVTGKPTTKGTFKCVVAVSDSESPPKSANISVSITIN
jgi:large repetitive protein